MEFTTFAEGFGFDEGPTWAPDGSLWISSITGAAIYHLAADGSTIETIEVGGGANGLTVDRDGALYVAQNGGVWGGKPGTAAGIQVVRDGTVSYLVEGLDAPNDLTFGPDGRLYFTDSRGESDPSDPSTAQPGRLYSCARDGSDLTLILEGPKFINGLAFTPAADALYLIETTVPHHIMKAPFSVDRGVGAFEEFVSLTAGWPDGMALDAEGNIWVATTMDHSIQVYDPSGTLLDRFPLEDGSLPTNLCFGGPALDEIYVSASGTGKVLRATGAPAGLPLHG